MWPRMSSAVGGLSRPLARAALMLLVIVTTSRAETFPVRPRIEELARGCDSIVMATVKSKRWTFSGEVWARAEVKASWKGAKVETVEFLVAGPSMTSCDIASATVGETYLLFLEKSERTGWVVYWEGRGQMTLRTENGEDWLCYDDVIFPKGTAIADLKQGEGDHTVAAVGLKRVRELVEGSIKEASMEQHAP